MEVLERSSDLNWKTEKRPTKFRIFCKRKNPIRLILLIFSFSLLHDSIFLTVTADLLQTHFYEELEAVYSDIPFYVRGLNCSPPTINEFPPDYFTQQERENGFWLVHLAISLYVFYAFAIVCGDHFVPSVERLSEEFHMDSDIAGATLMGIATSSPELFTNVVGTFIMKGDIGVGTVVGSAAFNLLIVAAAVGFDAKTPAKLDWWPFTRDMLFYGLSVVGLFVTLLDSIILWWEATILLLIYALYIYAIYHDRKMQSLFEYIFCIEATLESILRRRYRRKRGAWTLETVMTARNEFNSSRADIFTISQPDLSVTVDQSELQGNDGTRENNGRFEIAPTIDVNVMKPYTIPWGQSCFVWFQWIIGWPIRFIFSITIPDCTKTRWHRVYPLSFVMSSCWIAALSYVASWMMTIVGHTFHVPDTAFGVSIIAAGTSVPEVVSSLIVARKGLCTMAVSNSIGSNTFDILVCLAVPWLIRTFIDSTAKIYSVSLLYSTGMLIITSVIMYVIVAFNKFYVDTKVATIALLMYIIFLVVDSLLELNVFFDVNMPVCNS